MGRGWLALACVGAVLCAGCAQWPGFRTARAAVARAPSPVLERFNLEGRVSVKTGENAFSGGMTWDHARQEDRLLLRTPLGQGVAELHGTPQHVTLKDKEGRVYQATDAESLVREVVGMTLPLKGLSWWVVGHPQPGVPHRTELDEAGRLAVLEQADWRIEFGRYGLQEGLGFLPGKLVARRGEDLEIRLVVDQWIIP